MNEKNADYKFGNTFYNYYGNKGVKSIVYNILAPEQSQDVQPGMEYDMKPLPIFDNPNYIGSNKLKNKVAIITGGDSGLGRACSIAYVKEGVNPYELASTFVYLASNDSSYVTGQVFHINGGQVMG